MPVLAVHFVGMGGHPEVALHPPIVVEGIRNSLAISRLAVVRGVEMPITTNCLDEAEPLMRRALDIDQAAFGNEQPNVARDLNNLAQFFQATNRLDEAEPLMRRALDIDQDAFGNDHPNVARDLNNLAQLLQATNRPDEAEPLLRRSLDIFERSFGTDHPNTKIVRENLESLLTSHGDEPNRGGDGLEPRA